MRLGILLIAAVALVGCVDVVQYVSGDSSNIDVYFRLTLQKSAFEIANSFSDEPQDLDKTFNEEFKLDREDVLSELPPGIDADFTTVNTEYEYGFELRYGGSREALASAAAEQGGSFVPAISPRGMTIRLADTSNESESGDASGDQFAAAFLGGAKYRVFISKKLVSRVSSASLVGKDVVDVSVIELPDVWMVQFPISLWMMAPKPPTLTIEF